MPNYTVGSGKTYSTLQAALAAIPSDLSGTGIHHVIIDAGTYTPPAFISISNTNGSATDYISIEAASGSEHHGIIGAGVRLNFVSSGGNTMLAAFTNYTRVSDIIFLDPNGSNDMLDFWGHDCIARNCIAAANNSTTAFYSIGLNNLFINCIQTIYSAGKTPNYGFRLGGDGSTAYNCGAYGGLRGFTRNNGATVLVRNCWASSTLCFGVEGSGSWGASSNNASTDATAIGSSSLISQSIASFSFINYTGNDFHVNPGSSLLGIGVDLSSFFSTDVDGISITNWMIGFDFNYGPGSIVIGSHSHKIKPWPSCTITPAITWIQDSAGYWNGSDRGAAQDIYEAIASFQGLESNLNVLEQELDSSREAITLSNFNAPIFSPNVDHTGSITAAVLGIKRVQIQYGTPGHVYELQVHFRAISPTLLSTTPSVAALKVQEGFQAGSSYEFPKAFSFSQTAVYGDRRNDVGEFDAEFSQSTAQAQAILAYMLVTARASVVAFPSVLSTVAYPWGRTRGAATNCKIISFSISRKDLNRWAIKIRFAENS